MVAARLQRGKNGLNVLLDEEHRGENYVAGRDVIETFIQQFRILSPLGRSVQRNSKPRQFARKHLVRAGDRTGKVTVQRHDNEAHVSATSG